MVLSGRMISDHAMPTLVDILTTMNLDDIHEHTAFNTAKDEEEEGKSSFRMFICCSNPYGKLPLILTFLSLVATILSLLSMQACKFVSRSSLITVNGTQASGYDMSAGIYSYALRQCTNPDDCDVTDPDDLEDSKYCHPYPLLAEPDGNWKAAKSFSILSILSGFIGMALVSFSTCTTVKKKTWKLTCVFFLFATLSQGLQFLFLKSYVCTEWINPADESVVTSECFLAKGAYFAIVAIVFWFITAVGCAHMVRVV